MSEIGILDVSLLKWDFHIFKKNLGVFYQHLDQLAERYDLKINNGFYSDIIDALGGGGGAEFSTAVKNYIETSEKLEVVTTDLGTEVADKIKAANVHNGPRQSGAALIASSNS